MLDSFLTTQTSSLKSLTPKTKPLVIKHVGENLKDLVFFLPSRIRNFIYAPTLNADLEGKHVVVKGIIIAHNVPRQPQRPCQIVCSLGPQKIFLLFFQGHHSVFTRIYPLHKEVVISGLLQWRNQWQISHPTLLSTIAPRSFAQPLYSLTEGLHPQRYQAIVGEALTKIPNISEWIPLAIKEKYGWGGWKETLLALHHPRSEECFSPQNKARQRFAFDEFLAHNLSVGLITHHQKQEREAKPCPQEEGFAKNYHQALPFELTPCQKEACLDIAQDVLKATPMLRLLQGDVGSGKTAVAFFALLMMAQKKFQSVLLSPTEILAQQQFISLHPLATELNCSCRILTSNTPKKERAEILNLLLHGELDILVGTHAVLEKDVMFKNLNMVIIDEQHRFGVQQRLALVDKGFAPHTLIMSATPIPRSLTLTFFGGVEVSRLRARPRPFIVETKVHDVQNINDVFETLTSFMDLKNRVFWVCPLITPSEKKPLADATTRFEQLKGQFPNYVVELLHGRMSAQEKNKIIQRFREGEINLLVSTTVIEVGVDIPQCNLMVIEDAQSFGLAQLHQLRGRVGRQGEKATCILLHNNTITENGRQRLRVIESESDGFVIAEKDLLLRGAGDLLGIKQSGVPPFIVADFSEYSEIHMEAQTLAKKVIETNPFLEGVQGEGFRTLMRILRDDSLTYLLSG